MKKRILSTLLALCMALTLLPGWAEAADIPTSGSCGDNVVWNFDASSGTLTISGSGLMGSYGGYRQPWWQIDKSTIKEPLNKSPISS